MVWKLADFGLTTEATSRSYRVTTSVRGTAGYYAPEFLVGEKPQYNNKVDIWSMGCILYELAVSKQAFPHDIATLEYKWSGVIPNIPFDEYFSDECKAAIMGCINEMLNLDAELRPPAAKLVKLFCANFNQNGDATNDNMQVDLDLEISPPNTESSPPFASSTQVAPTTAPSTPTDRSISSLLDTPETVSSPPEEPLSSSQTVPETALTNPAEDDETIPVVEAEIQNEPYNFWLWHALCTLYATKDDLDGAIKACEIGARGSTLNPSPIMELMNLYAAKGNYKVAVDKGRELLKMKSVDLRHALTATISPLVASIVHEYEEKQSSLEIISKELLDPAIV